MSAIAAAQGRLAGVLQKHRRRIEEINADLARGTIGAAGLPSEYLAQRATGLVEERAQLEADMERLQGLSDDELVAELVWELRVNEEHEANPAPQLRDALKRGESIRPVIELHREAPAVRHEGPAAPVHVTTPLGAPEGWIPGQVHTPNG